jgi:hypothetical protein
MPIASNNRIRDLAEQALALANNDLVHAVEILRDWTGLSFDAAFAAIDAIVVLDDAPPSGSDNSISEQSDFDEDPDFGEDSEFAEDSEFGPDKDFEQ